MLGKSAEKTYGTCNREKQNMGIIREEWMILPGITAGACWSA
jgi:hypothetical protein